ncbi:MAG: IS630 family transposase [Cyanobacteria bacterium P01_H01_bin.58]
MPLVTRPLNRNIYPETLHLLQRIYRHSRHHEVRQRAQCLILKHQGLSIPTLLTVFQVSRKTLYKWFDAWDVRGFPGLYRRPGQGRKATFTAEQQAQIRRWAQDHPKQLKQVLNKIRQQWGVSISIKTIKRVLKALRLSWHRFRRIPKGRPEPQLYAAKQEQLRELKRLDDQGVLDLYYLDEAGFCLIPCVPYGWQPVGETLTIPSSRSQSLNVLGIMNRHHDLKAYTSEQSINSDVVILCIETFFAKVDKRTIIVMDQAPIHTSYAMQDKREEWSQRQLEIFELPSYSPELNLIEILWRFIKYTWLEASAYKGWGSLVKQVESILSGFGKEYVINFV